MKVITDVSVIHIVHTVSYSEFYLDFQICKRVCVCVCVFQISSLISLGILGLGTPAQAAGGAS